MRVTYGSLSPNQFGGSPVARGDARGDADAVVGRAAHDESGDSSEGGPDPLDAVEVPDEVLGDAAAPPLDAGVHRSGGIPQYVVGHLDRVARIRAAVAAVPGLAVCGAAYDGVGIAACIASGHQAATQLGTMDA